MSAEYYICDHCMKGFEFDGDMYLGPEDLNSDELCSPFMEMVVYCEKCYSEKVLAQWMLRDKSRETMH